MPRGCGERKPWAPADDAFLRKNYTVLPLHLIAESLNRTYGAAANRVSALGIQVKRAPRIREPAHVVRSATQPATQPVKYVLPKRQPRPYDLTPCMERELDWTPPA